MKLPICFVAVAFAAAPALAQDEGGRRRVVIDMDADVIEASLRTRDVAPVTVRSDVRFASLVRPRTSFARELLASVAELPR